MRTAKEYLLMQVIVLVGSIILGTAIVLFLRCFGVAI